MTDSIREQLKNRGDRYTRETADAQLKRIGLTLGDDFYPRRPATAAETHEAPTPQRRRRTAGGASGQSRR
jgi:hypothetical protein